jgi:MYXO-CTERM domain-containing protein
VDAEAADAGVDASPPPAYDPDRPTGCSAYDDLYVATKGLHKGDVWVTRLRANLAASALATDLHLAATSSQIAENNVHYASVYSDTSVTTTAVPRGNGCSSVPNKDSAGAASLFVLTGLFVRRLVRRRKQA